MPALAVPSLARHNEASAPGTARLGFRRSAGDGKTALATAFATSPLRVLTPGNHGDAAWVFLASLGGGLVDGDRLAIDVDVGAGASALLGTQASTKVYRCRASAAAGAGAGAGAGADARAGVDAGAGAGERGCSQHLRAQVAEGGLLAVVPDPVVCFAGARYEQTVEVTLAPSASVLLIDGYTCGRSACGERWAFSGYESRTTVLRGGERSIVDAILLDPRHGALAERMGRFDVVLSLVAVGPRLLAVRDAILATLPASGSDDVILAASPLGESGCLLRVAAERFELASLALRSSFAALAHGLGDDPFARKW